MNIDADELRKKDIPYSIVLDHILGLRSSIKNRIAERAFSAFIRETCIDEKTASDDYLHALFFEWFLFDYNYKNGKSPLEHFIDYHPASISSEIIDRFKQSAESNRIGNFWVERVFPRDGIVVISDTNTGEQFEILDYTMSGELGPNGCGMFGARIVHVDGEWVFAGNSVYYYPVSPTEEMKKILLDTDVEPVTFISLVKSTFGKKTEDDSNFTAPMLDVTPEEQEARLEELSHLFDKWHNEGIVALGWNDLAEAIKHDETLAMRPAKLIELAFAVDDKHESDINIDDMEAIDEIISALMDAWNLLPHNYLDGKSPTEPINA